MSGKKFQSSVEYLYSLGNEVTAMKLGLETTEKMLAALGNPEKNYFKVQIAGTNGKGSTCAFLNQICRNANVKTGLFTSPHLISITERIVIDGEAISEDDFARHATKIKELSEKLIETGALETVPTFFEQMTAIAVSAFADARIRLAILETGLGGRFDSVTATRAEIAAITPIDWDHQQYLGDTLAQIAFEKAAIIGASTRKAISVPQKNVEITEEIRLRCEKNNLEPRWAIVDIEQNDVTAKDLQTGVSFKTAAGSYSEVVLSLAGRHQFVNAVLAVCIAETLRDFHFDISRKNIIEGLQKAVHKGRLEIRDGILFDGAHNIAGANALKDYLDEFTAEPITMIFGAMRDKDLPEIAQVLFPKAARLIFTKPDNSRAYEPIELMKFLPTEYTLKNVFQTVNVEESLKTAAEISGEEDLVCVTGSLYLVGEAQKLLNNKSEI